MSKKSKIIDHQDIEKLSSKILGNLDIPFPSTKEEAWKSLNSRMENPRKEHEKSRRSISIYLALAASLALFLISGTVLRYHSIKFVTEETTISVHLPDNSEVDLNPGSELKYFPLWWKIHRDLELEGIADFKVTKGKRFKVVSDNGETEVLGTTFRIESQNQKYKVSCFTGSVKVTDPKTDVSAVIIENQVAELKSKGVFDIQLIQQVSPENRNKKDYFNFRNLPIREVVSELEIQFDVIIELEKPFDQIYTGNFKRDLDLDDILYAICLPLDLEYEKVSQNKYIIRHKNSNE